MKPARSPSPSAASASRAEALRARWKTLAPREQSLVLAAGTVVAVALLWWVALAPALRTLREAPAQHAALDAQLQRMQAYLDRWEADYGLPKWLALTIDSMVAAH
ncbi:type II secretion system protein GspM, partial [Paracidovorax avenae]|uniref:type II secretion system protein GspM n=1 Tax=Paracidovorax avenae TaxID=80867 RepID=UPI001CEF6C64